MGNTHFAHYRNGLHHQHRVDVRSYSCVSLSWLNAVTQYWSRNLCGFAYHRSTIHHTSLVVRVAISAFGEYFCRVLCEWAMPRAFPQVFFSKIQHPAPSAIRYMSYNCAFPYSTQRRMNESAAFFGNYPLLKCGVFTKIRNHVDKYVITKHYYQLMPLSLATYFWSQLKATWRSK
ncbi:hypothetical protein T01_11532 [Trichinella spiralis]|uniref:Uncharacterized protein n=1 Tax=Trichinella spiralis TaxID=6334 RepID=A0A0V1BMJ7_TRISP|nr:hypothetical protein T01_11532 [Trichinella spiralis]